MEHFVTHFAGNQFTRWPTICVSNLPEVFCQSSYPQAAPSRTFPSLRLSPVYAVLHQTRGPRRAPPGTQRGRLAHALSRVQHDHQAKAQPTSTHQSQTPGLLQAENCKQRGHVLKCGMIVFRVSFFLFLFLVLMVLYCTCMTESVMIIIAAWDRSVKVKLMENLQRMLPHLRLTKV